MRVVVDTNVVFSAMVSGGRTRELLIEGNLDMYAPEYLYSEIMKHEQTLKKKSGLEKAEVEMLLSLILENVEIVLIREYIGKYQKAKELIADEDQDDVPFLALALQKDVDVWSDEKHFQEQEEVKVWKTTELIRHLNM